MIKKLIRRLTQKQLPAGFDVDTHFNPPYNPWDQRLCLVPDGDLFAALRAGEASIATDTITRFTERGIDLASGKHLDADVIVTATGLNLLPMGGMSLSIDGERVDLATTVSYKGMMISGIPNFTMVIGYTNASWTLKADLVNRYVCRLLNHLDEHGYVSATPVAPPEGADAPFLDLASGYVQRSLDELPKQGSRTPWRLHQNYIRDVQLMRKGPLEDEGMTFQRPAAARTEPAAA
jgi:cation diffusion facilitator CzcD-associated flavoprotein CzcO